MYKIYTDGAYSSLRNKGGIGIVILKEDKLILEYSKDFANLTINQLELLAIIYALKFIKKEVDSIIIYSDSMYCIGPLNDNWKIKSNQKFWNLFAREYDRVKSLCSDIKFEHIKGHNNNYWNDYVDKLAVQSSQLL